MRRGVSLLPLILLACGPGATTGPVVKTPPSTTPAKGEAPIESPARWSLHATRLSNLRARLDLGGAILFGGDGGERWLDKRDGSPPTPANALIPEPIVGITKGAAKGVVIVGASGAVYVANDPLGAPEQKRTPPTPLRSPAAGRAAIVAIASSGLMRTVDGGATWSKIDLPSPGGTLVQVAMNDSGLGLALAAPQRVWATEDDGATWKAIATPSVGARSVVRDVNGDVMLEGVEASGLLRGSPLRLERVARAPKSDTFDLETSSNAAILSYARAITSGRGALIGDHYLEAIAENDDPTRWRIAFGKLGARLEAKKVAELNGCDRVWVGGDATSLYAACDDRAQKTPLGKPAATPERAAVRVYRSDDRGATWREDGVAGSRHADVGHVWVAPDRTLIIDGACKKLRAMECYDSPPVVRAPGSKAFAKVGAPGRVTSFTSIAFAPQGGRAYALARAPGGPLLLLVSRNSGRDFQRVVLPSVSASEANLPSLSPMTSVPGTVTIDASGLIVATAQNGTEWIVYTSKDEGQTIEGTRFPHRADGLSMNGKRGLAWARDGRAWETSDAGATWTLVAAPSFPDASPPDRTVVCGTHGCVVGDRATRVGWGAPALSTKSADASDAKVVARAPLACAAEGEWKPLGVLLAAPTAYDAEPTANARWLAIRQDTTKGSVTVVLGKAGAKGVETKDVSLFGPAPKDTATAVLPQVEGAAAIRFAFKREALAKDASKDPKDKKAKPPSGAILDNQKVDVDVAWYVAATGVVHRATIKGAGPLDPRDVIGGGKDFASGVNVGLLSIAQGGVHVRPFATKPEVPLWFVREGGKVDRLPWPELPSKDANGGAITPRIDAVRAGGRSVLLGMVGSQLLMSWANETGSGWDARAWGLWPDARSTIEASWDFSYLPGAGGASRPTVVVQWPGSASIAPVAWGVPLKGLEADPGEIVPMPTQKLVGDAEPACSATDTAPRVVTPWSVGTRHPISLSGDVGDQLLATAAAVLRGDGKSACVVAYEAKPITRPRSDKPKPADEGALSAILPWADREHAFLFRTTMTGEASIRALKCTPAKDTPSGLSGVEGFSDRPAAPAP